MTTVTTAALLGDSQAGGIKEPLGELLRAAGWTTVAAAHQNGASTRALVDGGPLANALERRPDVLVVFAGGNDTSSSGTAWGDLVSAARRAGARVIWVGPPAAVGDAALDASRAAVSEAQRVFFATKPDVVWIDGRATADGLPRRDSVHLTIPSGYRRWAERLAPLMVGSGGSMLLAIGIAGLAVWGAWRIAQRSSGFRGLEAVGKRFLLQIDDEVPVEVSSRDFFRDNKELDLQTKREIRKLKVGEQTWGGGGAAVHWQIRRVG